jgi:hypothetical protein
VADAISKHCAVSEDLSGDWVWEGLFLTVIEECSSKIAFRRPGFPDQDPEVATSGHLDSSRSDNGDKLTGQMEVGP